MAENEGIDSIGAIGAIDSIGSTHDSAPSEPVNSSVDGGSAAPSGVRQARPQGTSAEIQDSVKRINERLASVNRVLELAVDASTGLTIATVRNSQSGEVLLQYPSADMLHLAQMLASWAGGKNILLDLIA